MRYYWLIILIVLIIGCSGSSPTVPMREADSYPYDDNGLSDSVNDFYRYDCAPYETKDLWGRIYEIIGDKNYEAIYGYPTGEMEILTNPFGVKIIDGLEFEYQYGFLVKVISDGSGVVMTQTVIMLAEPMGTMQLRIRIFAAGVIDNDSWLGVSSRYLQGHPVSHYQFEMPLTDCEIQISESHKNIDVTGIGINDLTVWAAWFYPAYYDAVADEIDGYVRVQYTYEPTDTNFVQIWKVTLIRV